jgi:hypothetical protein
MPGCFAARVTFSADNRPVVLAIFPLQTHKQTHNHVSDYGEGWRIVK